MSVIIEGKPQLPPGMCFICEQSNPVRYVDTYRDFEGVVRERLDGRKYVCEECVEDLSKHLGFVTPARAQELEDRLKQAGDLITALRKEVGAYQDIKDALEALNAPKPKPATRKPAAAKA